ncbi:MAG: response regulator [Syntrophaceae bacterium]|nr:response regulator [Syntrophaceae bacterium]
MVETVLFVDDEEHILNALGRLFSDENVRMLRASSAEEALKLIKKGKVAVLVSDNLMPGMNGVDLLSKTKELSPDTMRVLMTGYADLPTAIDAINRSEIFRFITKPWEDRDLINTVEEGIHRYKVVQTLKEADEGSLLSLAQAIELKDPYTRGHCNRVASYALMIADDLHLSKEMKKEIKYGSWLHDLGKIGVPEAILNNKGPLNEEDYETVKKHPAWGADVANQSHLSKVVVNIILHHHERYDGKGYPSGLMSEDIPLEARIVAVADVYDAITTDRPYRKGYPRETAIGIISSLKGKSFDPEIVEVFLHLIRSKKIAP